MKRLGYTGNYVPVSTDNAGNPGEDDPSQAQFSDTITAEGTDNVNAGTVQDNASNTCDLCPKTP